MEYRIGNIYNRKIEKCDNNGEVVLTIYNDNIDVDKIMGRFNNSNTIDFDAEIYRLENIDYSLYGDDAEIVRANCFELIEKYKAAKKERYIKNKKRSVNRAINKLFRYAELNAFQYKDCYGKAIKPCMVTLTFRENMQDFDYANKQFTNYIKRLNYYVYGYKCSDLRYVAVTEFQTKNFHITGRHAIHFHILFFNLPFINLKDDKIRGEWNSLWTEGECPDIKCKDMPNNAEGIAKYITKYMTKQFYFDINCSDSKRFVYDPDVWEDKKIYFASRNLIKPDIYKVTESEFNEILFLFDDLDCETKDIVCSYQEHNGIYVDRVIGSAVKFKLTSERLNILNQYLSMLSDYEIVDYDCDWEEPVEEYSLIGEFL